MWLKDASGTATTAPKLTPGKPVLSWILEVQAWALYTTIEENRQRAMVCAISMEPNSERREECMAWPRANLASGTAQRGYTPAVMAADGST